MKGSPLAVLALLTTLGCVSVRPVERGTVPELSPGEGILVVDVETAVPIKQIDVSRVTVGSDLAKGEHFYLVVMSAGRHRWTDIVIPAGEGDVPFRMAYGHDAWGFRIEAGRINYPDQLRFGGRTRAKSVDISVRRLNRSALALRKLRSEFPEVLERYPPVYAGPTRDDYLEYFGRSFPGADGAPTEARAR